MTDAVRFPVGRTSIWEEGEFPETYPFIVNLAHARCHFVIPTAVEESLIPKGNS